jgi:hypothetical protein
MPGTRVFVVFAVAVTIFTALCVCDAEFFAKAATPANTCGTVGECAQAAAMSAKTASDAEIRLGARLDELAAQVRSLKEELTKAEGVLTRIGASEGNTAIAPFGRGSNEARHCPTGQYVSGIIPGYSNPGHGDSDLGNLTLECRNAVPESK